MTKTNPSKHPVNIEDGFLSCPHCKSTYIHQIKTVAVFRDSEDKDGLGVILEPKKSILKRLKSKDIPIRRDYTSIVFWCECCLKEDFCLSILQSKGQTLIFWDFI